MKKAILLINLGTPQSPSVTDVRNYLKEFLMDPRVIDVPFLIRWMIVNLAILPKRPQSSAEAYKKIWTEKGSPLLVYLESLKNKLQLLFSKNSNVHVFSAMRYGKPSILLTMKQMKNEGITEIVLLPLYPQYSLAATQSSIEEFDRVKKILKWDVQVKKISFFYNHPDFIHAYASLIKTHKKNYPFDHLLMSFHGLPERQIKKTDSTKSHCLVNENCCEKMVSANQYCYRAQCYETARRIAKELNLSSNDYTVCFQSRLGVTPWIKPYTDELYTSLPKKGIRNLAVVCPAFVADCLETLEEVQIRGKEQWIENGGEDLRLIPSLNDSQEWVEAVKNLVT